MTPPVTESPAKLGAQSGRWKSIIPGVSLLIFGLLAGVLVGKKMPTADKPETDKPAPPNSENSEITFAAEKWAGAGIEITPVVPEAFNHRTWRPGRVAYNEERLAHIFPPADGVIRDVKVRIGQAVNAGDVLAIIDSREFGNAKLDAVKTRAAVVAEREIAARNKITTANATELLSLLEAETPLTDIEKKMTDKPIGEWRQQLLTAYSRRNQLRSQLLALRNSGTSTSETNLRKIEAEAEAATAGYTAVVEELRFQIKNLRRQSEVKLAEAETNYNVALAHLVMFGVKAADIEKTDPIAEGASASHLPVRAPFAGVIVEKHAVLSERVGPTFQMFVLADLSKLWVQSDVFESDLPLVRGLNDKPVVFRSPLSGVTDRAATVIHSGDLIDKSSRTLTVTAEAANSDKLLKPGMFIEMGFELGDPSAVIQVPASAVLRHENKPFVFVQSGDNSFRKAEVSIGRTTGDKVEITEGLKSGDKIVVKGGFSLKSEMLKDQLVGE